MKKYMTPLRWSAFALLLLSIIIGINHGVAAFGASFVASGLALAPFMDRDRDCAYTYTGVTLAEIFIPEVYASIQPNNSPETTAFATSGVAVTNPILQAAAQAGARLVDVPLWNDLDSSSAPNLSDDTDTEALPGKVDTSDFSARNSFLNKGYGAADLAVEVSGTTPGEGNPMTRIANRFGAYWARQFQYRIIAACRGVLAKNIAADSSDMVYDISLQTTVGQTAANKMSAEAVVNAVFTMGDQFEKLGAIAMHSVPYQNLVLQDLITFMKDSTGTLSIPIYLGKRVVVDDGLPVIAGTTSGFRYVSILFGQGAIGYGTGKPKVAAEVYRLPRAGNGGGTEEMWERKTWMIHPFGMDWLEGSVAGASATLAELRLAANWARVLPRKNVPMAFLITNG